MTDSKKDLNLDLVLEEPISSAEISFSQELFGVIEGKKIVGVRVLFKKKCELALFFEDGSKLFVDNFNNPDDIAVSLPDSANACAAHCDCHE